MTYHEDGRVEIKHGDCRELMAAMAADSVDSIVTDPPYGLEFMGKDWDHGTPGVPFWQAAARVAKPGAHLLAFGGTRTFHRLACAIEDAGWEIRDCVMWVYGSGFPKSLDVSKAIDKAAGAEREVVGRYSRPDGTGPRNNCVTPKCSGRAYNGGVPGGEANDKNLTAPATDAAREWDGWGTALKPAWEPVIVARKPVAGTVADNVQRYGTGAMNVDGCRVDGKRWPANLVHDGSDEVTGLFPVTTTGGDHKSGRTGTVPGSFGLVQKLKRDRSGGETGSVARFYYTSKASQAERHSGGEGTNDHPTVKPVDLMRHLIKLVTPPGGLVLDPFMGSGSTLVAAKYGGWRAIGMDLDEKHCSIAERRCAQGVLI